MADSDLLDDELDLHSKTLNPKGQTDYRLFCWKRALRGVGVGLSLIWFVLFHVGIISQAPFRVPVRMKVRVTVITVLAMTTLVLCLRGRSRIVIGCLMMLFAVLSLWGYWMVPGPR
jgi:hypothetical protein